ncbi:SDR family oxidoreductase [Pseudomonas sp. RC10]|uniref:SDR family NAD(P)-dependent oxidoreductase n=1 Tax=Pseudomonas bambusae TaxID=3139142 RepID=UPI0031388830
MPTSLIGKTALVTGGSRGIGRAIAERLAQEGAVVALTYNTDRASADRVVAAIEHAGGRAFALQADLTDAHAIPTVFETLDRQFTERQGSTRLDILVNNAGNAGWGALVNATPESWDTLFAVHARAPFFVVQSALTRLAQGGRIINISSATGSRPLAAVPIYSMAKASINNLTHALASELGPRSITVNAIAPGWVRTDMNAAVREDAGMVKAIEADTALGRFGETDDVAAIVAFLASEEGRWITAQVIEASGGYKL